MPYKDPQKELERQRKRRQTPEWRAYQREYRQRNKERIRDSVNQWRENNRANVRAWVRKHDVSKIQNIPEWADLEYIKNIYKNCPDGYQVDHVVPLSGKIVCGLHVEYNLQYLTPEQNYKKANKFPFEDYI